MIQEGQQGMQKQISELMQVVSKIQEGKTRPQSRQSRKKNPPRSSSRKSGGEVEDKPGTSQEQGETPTVKEEKGKRRSRRCRRKRGKGGKSSGEERSSVMSESSTISEYESGSDRSRYGGRRGYAIIREVPKPRKFETDSSRSIDDFFRDFEKSCRDKYPGRQTHWVDELEKSLEGDV
jgi:hypothetical protein